MQKVREKPGPLNASFLIYRRTAFHAAEKHESRKSVLKIYQSKRQNQIFRENQRTALKVYSEGNGKQNHSVNILQMAYHQTLASACTNPHCGSPGHGAHCTASGHLLYYRPCLKQTSSHLYLINPPSLLPKCIFPLYL